MALNWLYAVILIVLSQIVYATAPAYKEDGWGRVQHLIMALACFFLAIVVAVNGVK